MSSKNIILEPEALLHDIQTGLNSNICIVDLSSEASYLTGHIPGAIFLPFQALLNGQAPVPGKIASVDQLNNVFSFLGLNEDTHFIVYDDEGGGWAGRFIWTLDVIGHKHYQYLNGGLTAWKDAGFELDTINNQPTPSKASVSIDAQQVVEISDILEGINNKRISIWDARSPAEYRGERGNSAKMGHIPGAINAEWTSLMDHNNGLKIRPDAKIFLANLGLDGSQPIVTHCQSHHRSGFTYLVGKSLGYNILGYHGSWAEWGNHPDTPVEK